MEGCCASLQSQLEQTNSLLATATSCISQLQARVLHLEKALGDSSKDRPAVVDKTSYIAEDALLTTSMHQVVSSSICREIPQKSTADIESLPASKFLVKQHKES